jgi:hypothetical protein
MIMIIKEEIKMSNDKELGIEDFVDGYPKDEGLEAAHWRIADQFPGEYVVVRGYELVCHSKDLGTCGRAFDAQLEDGRDGYKPVLLIGGERPGYDAAMVGSRGRCTANDPDLSGNYPPDNQDE